MPIGCKQEARLSTGGGGMRYVLDGTISTVGTGVTVKENLEQKILSEQGRYQLCLRRGGGAKNQNFPTKKPSTTTATTTVVPI